MGGYTSFSSKGAMPLGSYAPLAKLKIANKCGDAYTIPRTRARVVCRRTISGDKCGSNGTEDFLQT